MTLLLTSCASMDDLIATFSPAQSETYGYTKDNPVLIGHYNSWQKNTNLTYKFLSELSYKGRPLEFLGHATVRKPKDQPRKKKALPLRYGAQTNLGGKFLDLYILSPKGLNDTLRLYFDVEIEGKTKIPKGFELNLNQPSAQP